MKRSWKDKLTSRKFWAAVVGVAVALMILFGVDSAMQEKIVALITASATLIAYILAEGKVDSSSANDNFIKTALQGLSYSCISPKDNKQSDFVTDTNVGGKTE